MVAIKIFFHCYLCTVLLLVATSSQSQQPTKRRTLVQCPEWPFLKSGDLHLRWTSWVTGLQEDAMQLNFSSFALLSFFCPHSCGNLCLWRHKEKAHLKAFVFKWVRHSDSQHEEGQTGERWQLSIMCMFIVHQLQPVQGQYVCFSSRYRI